MTTGGIVLCGGRSSRMGQPKAWLPFGGEPMLARVVRILREVVEPVVVVAAPDQDVPPLPAGVLLARDEIEGRGPLAGLAAGLAALEGKADAAYLSSCDVPLLVPEFVRRVVGMLAEPNPPGPPQEPPQPPPWREGVFAGSPSLQGGGWGWGLFGATVPRVHDRLHPLAAGYRVGVLPVVREMLAAGRLRMMDLFAVLPTRFIESHELADIDPAFSSLRNLNSPDEYDAALRELDAAGSGESRPRS